MASTLLDTLTFAHVKAKYFEAIYSGQYFKTLYKV